MVRLDSPRHDRTISGPRNRMDRAMAALSGGSGARAYPSVAMARVMECATVKDVMVFRSIIRPRTISNNPNTNSRWSIPSRIWWKPRPMNSPAMAYQSLSPRNSAHGFVGLATVVMVLPSSLESRTKTSVMVASKPGNRIVLPSMLVAPVATTRRHTMESALRLSAGGPMVSQPSGSCNFAGWGLP